jgi:hypothetical protein
MASGSGVAAREFGRDSPALGKHGSIAVVERFILTLKTGCTERLLPSYSQRRFTQEVLLFADWYNRHRPHMTLGGRTPHEVYHRLRPANRAPRFEPRPRWPRGSHCAEPQTLIKGQPGATLQTHLAFHAGRKHLPIVTIRRAG